MKKILLIAIILFSLFLNLNNISRNFTFIGDQGWFYLSARDMILKNEIPLVGITSSHTWIHQGPFWTYILAFIFLLFGFSPAVPAYFTAIMGTFSVCLLYTLTKRFFSENVALFSSLFYAFSPLVILSFRMPYHTTLIPIFSILFLYFTINWVKGSKHSFIFSIFTLSVLYNFELATQVLWGIVLTLLAYGFLKKTKWFKNLMDNRIIALSIIAFIVPLIPVIIYDFNHGYNQTVKFFGWVIYSIFKPEAGRFEITEYISLLKFFYEKLGMFIFPVSGFISVLIFGLSILLLIIKRAKLRKSELVLLLCLLLPILGIVVTKTPSDAYLPPLFPYLAILLGLGFNGIFGNKTSVILSVVIVVSIVNAALLLKSSYFPGEKGAGLSYSQRENTARKIIKLANSRDYNLKTKEETFESYLMNYRYILWWMGNEPKEEDVEIKFYISETQNSVKLKYTDEK